jgi:hypothetical protein
MLTRKINYLCSIIKTIEKEHVLKGKFQAKILNKC